MNPQLNLPNQIKTSENTQRIPKQNVTDDEFQITSEEAEKQDQQQPQKQIQNIEMEMISKQKDTNNNNQNHELIININGNSSSSLPEKINLLDINSKQQRADIQAINYSQNYKDIIVLRNIHKTYLLGIEGVAALRGVDLRIQEREFVCIFGTSGGGKTSMLNIMGTIDKPTKGEVWICGHKIKSNTNDQILASLRLNYLGFVFQSFNLLGSLTALENVALPMTLRGELSKSQINQRARELLKKVGLESRVNHFPNQLSGGEQQRVTIARALSNNPKILLLDEPTGDLDTKNTDVIMDILLQLNQQDGITMVMVTHDQALKNYANRAVRMIDGRIGKIEVIDEESRLKALQNLQNNIIQIRSLNQQENQLGVRQGVTRADGEGLQQSGFQKTEFRKPTDYPALVYAQSKNK